MKFIGEEGSFRLLDLFHGVFYFRSPILRIEQNLVCPLYLNFYDQKRKDGLLRIHGQQQWLPILLQPKRLHDAVLLLLFSQPSFSSSFYSMENLPSLTSVQEPIAPTAFKPNTLELPTIAPEESNRSSHEEARGRKKREKNL